ncbi:putative metalloprotease [Actinophytocola oryzae]|uniref:Putative metalloprotease n=1 Tax=Actinophytocola oryzae TaxID=502181 RepID=A0A4R7VXV0_9PSEU|nr:putative metalloprotease [Actinophytocola oryzae]
MRVVLTLAAVAAMVVQVGGCAAQVVPGRPSAATAIDPNDAGGLDVNNDGPTGPRQGVPDADLTVEGTTGSEEDRLATNAVADLYDYWDEQLPGLFDEKFTHIQRLVSYDSNGAGVTICGESTAGFVNAFYCGGNGEDAIAWDRGVLLPSLTDMFGPMSVVGVLAHEMGHAVQFRLGEKSSMSQSTPTIVREQQADCYMGNFMRWVVDDKSKHFQLNTGKGLNDILATLFFIRDPAGLDHQTQGAHGLAFDRVFAFQEGFSHDPKRCATMDVDEIDSRITEQERSKADDRVSGNAPIDDNTLGLLQDSLDDAFKDNGAEQPEITQNDSKCEKGKSTSPATYCPDENIVGIDVNKLKQIAKPPAQGTEPGTAGAGIGDFAAFAEIASRYTLAIQKQIGADLDDENAGLRTACLTGAWTAFTVDKDPNTEDKKLHLAVGDLDEAVAELLQDDSLIAADINGNPVESGFARVEAFRRGYKDGSAPCSEDFI